MFAMKQCTPLGILRLKVCTYIVYRHVHDFMYSGYITAGVCSTRIIAHTFTAAHLLASAMLASARVVSNLEEIELCSSLLAGIQAGHRYR